MKKKNVNSGLDDKYVNIWLRKTVSDGKNEMICITEAVIFFEGFFKYMYLGNDKLTKSGAIWVKPTCKYKIDLSLSLRPKPSK